MKEGIYLKKFLIFLFFIVGLFLLILTNTSWLSFAGNNDEISVTDDISKIKIDVSSVGTIIIPEKRDTVAFDYKGKGKVKLKQNGNTIKVELQSRNWINFFSFNNKKLTIYLPEQFDKELNIKSRSGNVQFSGKSKMELDKLAIEIGSGNIEVQDISANTFKSEGSSGNLEIHSLTANSGTVKMKSGNIEIKDYIGELSSSITSGRLDLHLAELSNNLSVKVNSGNATVDIPDSADFLLKGEIGSGDISTNYALSEINEEKHSIEGKSGTGKHDIILDVNSGRIELE